MRQHFWLIRIRVKPIWVKLRCSGRSRSTLKSMLKTAKLVPSENVWKRSEPNWPFTWGTLLRVIHTLNRDGCSFPVWWRAMNLEWHNKSPTFAVPQPLTRLASNVTWAKLGLYHLVIYPPNLVSQCCGILIIGNSQSTFFLSHLQLDHGGSDVRERSYPSCHASVPRPARGDLYGVRGTLSPRPFECLAYISSPLEPMATVSELKALVPDIILRSKG